MRQKWLIWPFFVSVVLAQPRAFEDGLAAYQRGDFEAVIQICSTGLQASDAKRSNRARSELLLLRSSAFRSLGENGDAFADLRSALGEMGRNPLPPLTARILIARTGLEVASGRLDNAEQSLDEAGPIVSQMRDQSITAEFETARGELLEARQQFEAAVPAYMAAAKAARQADRPLLTARNMNAAARVMDMAGNHTGAAGLLNDAAAAARSLPASHDRDVELIRTATLAGALPPDNSREIDLDRMATAILEEAAASAERLEDWRNASQAWGATAELLTRRGRLGPALDAVRKAEQRSRISAAPDLLYRWEWLSGRILRALGRSEDATDAYTRAVDTLQSVRSVSRRAVVAPVSFRQAEGRLYFELVDLLLLKAGRSEAAASQDLLRRAVLAVENFKRSELADYYRNDCVQARQTRSSELDNVSPRALVVYPIPLPDRLELIFGSASGLKRATVPVAEAELVAEVRTFRALLEKRTTNEYRIPARKLYDWLIRPIESQWDMAGVDTLVFVPDGALQSIPFGALHTGTEFLISKYAVAVTPSFTLADSRPMPTHDISLLAAGLSTSHGGFSSLPGVRFEIGMLETLFPVKVLLDRQFVSKSLGTEIRTGRYNAVHIASHGVFTPWAEDSFLLAHDGKLTMDTLGELIGATRFADRSVELLVLSGCETAAGDDRAALGLAGVALHSGAKSALATLWHVNDDSTAALITRFYQHLASGSVTKARALQQAQQEMLQHTWYRHPGYWSPFLLLNNWL